MKAYVGSVVSTSLNDPRDTEPVEVSIQLRTCLPKVDWDTMPELVELQILDCASCEILLPLFYAVESIVNHYAAGRFTRFIS